MACPLYYAIFYGGIEIVPPYATEDEIKCGLECQGDVECEGFSFWKGLCYRYSNIQSQIYSFL